MQVIINISEGITDYIKNNGCLSVVYNDEVAKAIKNGTPLPKGHGRILVVSEDVIKKEQTFFDFSFQKWIDEVGLSNATIAIIEADKESGK